LGWAPSWNIETAVAKTVEWQKAYQSGEAERCTDKQIASYKFDLNERGEDNGR
jgi:hypothetical protein